MKQYHQALQTILDEGVDTSDRTGTGTRSYFGMQMRYDLRDGFPLMTTKKLHTKSIIHELLWFLAGDTNIKYLNENGVRIWDEWRQKWTSNRDLVMISRKKFDYEPYNGNFSFKGINAPKGSIEQKLGSTWTKMMKRCYDKNAHNYQFYGAKGISVCKRWHNPKMFVEDVQNLPHWWYKKNDWNTFQLDKDYYASNQYHPEACIWLPTHENVSTDPVGIRFPDGTVKWYMGYSHASEETSISRTSLHRFVTEGLPTVLKGNNKSIEGWEFIQAPPDNKLIRRALIPDGELGPVYGAQWRAWPTQDGGHVDQIKILLDTIKNAPDSRRMLVSAWNPAEVDNMALPPCHTMWQVKVLGDTMHLQLYQRSADMFLGVPFNIASYALLLAMLAHVTGYKPGTFVHTLGDAHIYNNHMDQVKLQLTRDPLPLPTLVLNPDVTNLFDFTFDDISIENYESHPHIKGEVSV